MELAQLWVFFILVLGVVALPGLDMAFVLASSMAGGRRSGWAATAGIVAGGVCHVAMSVLGVMAVFQLAPVLFNALLAAGAVYLGWIGLSLLKIRAAIGLARAPQAPQTLRSTFLRGMTTSLLNPKAYVFMVAVFPQFMEPEFGHMWGAGPGAVGHRRRGSSGRVWGAGIGCRPREQVDRGPSRGPGVAH